MFRKGVGVLTLTVIVGVLFFALPSSQCRNPVFVGNAIETPQQRVERLVAEWGGLPREDTGLGAVELAQTTLYPVATWHITKMNVHVTEGQPLFDDDPTYGITAEIDATYADGSRATLEWEAWRYGEVRCPFVVNVGDGPPGRINVLNVESAPS